MDCFMEIMVQNRNTTPPGTTPLVSDPGTCGSRTTRVRARRIPGASKVKQLRIGSWNVGSMNKKSYQLEEVMNRRKIDILCVQETKWKNLANKARFLNTTTKRYKIHYHGTDNRRNGVGVIVSNSLQNSILTINKVSDRLMNVKLVQNKEVWNIISSYAPQMGCPVTEKEAFWTDLENLLETIPSNEIIFIGADFNGRVGNLNQGDKRWHGGFAYGTANEQGKYVVRVAKSHDLAILNTFFKKQERHLITYSDGGRESQIDYHLCTRSIRKFVKDCKVILGEDVVGQHRLLLTEFRLKNNENGKDTSVRTLKTKWYKICTADGARFVELIQEWLHDICIRKNELNADEMWQKFQDKCVIKAKEMLGVSKGRLNIRKEPWFWKGNDIKEAVKNKKLTFQAWKKCPNNSSEKERLRNIMTEAKKLSNRVVAKRKAIECRKLYEDLESPDGAGMIFKIATQRKNNAKPIASPKFIEDENGNLITDNKQITQVWKKYYEQLLNEEFPRTVIPHCVSATNVECCDISEDEVAEAINKMKRGRAVGPDEIPSEVWKTVGQVGVAFLCIIFNKLLKGDLMPKSFRESFLLPFFKNKGDTRMCNNYRGIKLLSHTMKIWERIINNRLLKIVLPKIHPNQCGFVPDKSTADAIQAMRILVEKFRDASKDLHLIFIDLEKAFDRVPRDLIWTALRSHEVPEIYVNIIRDMYNEATTRIRCVAGISNLFSVGVGVHQGSVLSPLLFNIVMNYITSNITDKLLLSVLFADDVGLASDDAAKLQDIFNKWKDLLESNGLRISESKTEYLHLPFSNPCAPSPDMMINSKTMQKCTSFKYLGSIISKDGYCDADVNHRISVGWLKWRQNSTVFCDKRMPPKLKGKMHTTVIRPTLTYSSRCWTMYQKYEQDLTAAEMKMMRMTMGVSKLDHIKSKQVRGSMHVKESIVEKIKRERIGWFEKLYVSNDTNVANKILQLEMPFVRKRGRPKNTWARQMKDQQEKFGLTEQEKEERLNARMTLRTRST